MSGKHIKLEGDIHRHNAAETKRKYPVAEGVVR
jgi:hypothetical protein